MENRLKYSWCAIVAAALVAIVAFAPPLPAAANVIVYTIKPGDTLSAIAKQHGSTVTTLAAYNNLANPNQIVAGQKLQIPVDNSASYTIKKGDTLWDISLRQGISLAALKAANPGLNPQRLAVGSSIRLPVSDRTVVVSRGQGAGIALAWPVNGQISSTFGWRQGRMHQGLDIAASSGQVIGAAAPGQVVTTGWYGGYGQRVIIDHGRGIRTLYAHCSSILVKPGDTVRTGQAIARVGTTGNSTGPHLHLEVHVGGRPYDPLQFLR
ncbi:MAG: LysM peptidoglycan-binding domain-containing M23 family metallopeptidase [bacterium]